LTWHCKDAEKIWTDIFTNEDRSYQEQGGRWWKHKSMKILEMPEKVSMLGRKKKKTKSPKNYQRIGSCKVNRSIPFRPCPSPNTILDT
jgi:hypothetical protein